LVLYDKKFYPEPVAVNISSENHGETGWYQGYLQRDSREDARDDYQLAQEDMRSARISGNRLLDEVYDDIVSGGMRVMLHGEIVVEEMLTGGYDFELRDVDQAAAVLENDYQGWTVGVSGNDLVFASDGDFMVEEAESMEGLEENMKGWFNDREEYLEQVESWEYELDNWPWKN
jgi:hypothetical protein